MKKTKTDLHESLKCAHFLLKWWQNDDKKNALVDGLVVYIYNLRQVPLPNVLG